MGVEYLMDEESAGLEERVREDPDAFGRLFELNYDRIFNFILYSTGDVEASLDLTSEAFFKSLKALHRFDRRKGSFTAWLYAIASREISMHRRRLGLTRKHVAANRSFAREAGELRRGIPIEDIEDARKELEGCEDSIMLAPLLRELAPKYREVIFLRFFEDRPLQEIADLLGRPLGTVKAQCHRGLKILRGLMQPPEGPEHIEIWEVEGEVEKALAMEAGTEEVE
jgi:RNA polymerase sigma-70 factor (ECF subfamily)